MDGLLMAQQLQTVSIKAAGFSGLNTEDSPVTIDPSFAEVAENAIIDKYGRIAARNGIVPVSTTGYAVFNKQPVKSLFEFVDYNEIYNADKPKKKTTRRSRRGGKPKAAAVTPAVSEEEE